MQSIERVVHRRGLQVPHGRRKDRYPPGNLPSNPSGAPAGVLAHHDRPHRDFLYPDHSHPLPGPEGRRGLGRLVVAAGHRDGKGGAVDERPGPDLGRWGGYRRRCWSKASIIAARVWSLAAVCVGEAKYACSSS